MFKLESYLTPWLLSYLDKYVMLKPEDFQLSLWGGDAVFSKLDLRLNAIENLANVPITFKSGVVHELRIHIPWTRIASEPVVVTINTLEFVAKLKDTEQSPSKAATAGQATSQNLESDVSKLAQQQQQVPAGYIQSIISKILFNVCIIVNNVIVKFVEDDMVLSVNMKSAECYSVNEQWEKAFVDVSMVMSPVMHLRKILQLNDVTICLDRVDNKSSGRVSTYEDPLIYRCSIQSRLDFVYKAILPASVLNNNAAAAVSAAMGINSLIGQQLKLIKMNFYCRKFDVSISDQQLPMLNRLLELVLAIVDGTLESGSSRSDNNSEKEVNKEHAAINTSKNDMAQHESSMTSINSNTISEQQQLQQTNDQGWLSWAWSYVPSISTMVNVEEVEHMSLEKMTTTNLVESSVVENIISFYFDELNITFKLMQLAHSGKSYSFVAFMLANCKGIAIECIRKGVDFMHLIFGISYINMKSLGECCCKLCPQPNHTEVILLNAGNSYLEEKTFHYLSGSLFDIIDDDTLQQRQEQNDQQSAAAIVVNAETDMQVSVSTAEETIEANMVSRNKHGVIDENYGSVRFGAIYMDYFSSQSQQESKKHIRYKNLFKILVIPQLKLII
jgi:vacuolar protein sorting-associated protein 13B